MNRKIHLNGGLLTYIGWFLGILPAVIVVRPIAGGFIDILLSTFRDPIGHTAETFVATLLLASIGFIGSILLYQSIVLILCPILVAILLHDYPQRRVATVLWLILFLFAAPAWLLIGYYTSLRELSLALVMIWSIISPYLAWRLSDRK